MGWSMLGAASWLVLSADHITHLALSHRKITSEHHEDNTAPGYHDLTHYEVIYILNIFNNIYTLYIKIRLYSSKGIYYAPMCLVAIG